MASCEAMDLGKKVMVLVSQEVNGFGTRPSIGSISQRCVLGRQGDRIEVNKRVALVSEMIKTMVEDDDETNEIPLMGVETNVLTKVGDLFMSVGCFLSTAPRFAGSADATGHVFMFDNRSSSSARSMWTRLSPKLRRYVHSRFSLIANVVSYCCETTL